MGAVCALLLPFLFGSGQSPGPSFLSLANGIEYAALRLPGVIEHGDGRLHVVRIDPRNARLVALTHADSGGKSLRAGEWAEEYQLVAVINAGMYAADHRTHTGYFKIGDVVNNPKWAKNYNSVLLLDPVQSGLTPATIVDLDAAGAETKIAGYRIVSQNLRLIKGKGTNAWAPNARRWSEAAVAMDASGRILFLHARSPMTMRDFAEFLLKSELGIVKAFHAEGGPEASLSIRSKNLNIDLQGCYETGFMENDDCSGQWPLPNVLGVEELPPQAASPSRAVRAARTSGRQGPWPCGRRKATGRRA